jgi:hypothetical protein
MIDISILLPSIREEAATNFIDWVNSQPIPYTYEIVLVAPFNVERPNVSWLEDKGPHNGAVKPTNDGYAVSKGEFMALASDDAPFDFGWWTIIDFIKAMDPKLKYRIAGFAKSRMRLFQHVYKHPKLRKLPLLIKPLHQSRIHGIYFPCWFCADRNTIDLLGGTPNRTEFIIGCGDPDIGLKLHWAGEPTQFCPTARVLCHDIDDEIHQSHTRTSESHDIAVLNSIWADRYGEFKPWGDLGSPNLNKISEISL